MSDGPTYLCIPILWAGSLNAGDTVVAPRTFRRTKVDELLDEAVSHVRENERTRAAFNQAFISDEVGPWNGVAG